MGVSERLHDPRRWGSLHAANIEAYLKEFEYCVSLASLSDLRRIKLKFAMEDGNTKYEFVFVSVVISCRPCFALHTLIYTIAIHLCS